MAWQTETRLLVRPLPSIAACLAVDANGRLGAFGNFDGKLMVHWRLEQEDMED
jgi:hypothetical protein